MSEFVKGVMDGLAVVIPWIALFVVLSLPQLYFDRKKRRRRKGFY